MSILEQTLPASYKGVPFLVTRANTSGGIKNVKHVFPNSSNQVIEKLGARQRSYSVQAIINNDPAIDDYESKKTSLISVLSDEESGVLVHPLFGHINNIVATDWNLDEDFSALGQASFSITFEVDLPQSVPQVSSNTLSQVETFSSSVVAAVTGDFASDYIIDFFNNVTDAVTQVNDLVKEFDDNTFVFTIVTDSINDFNNQLSEFGNNVVNLIRKPLELGQTVENLFETAAGMYLSVTAAFDVMVAFFDFGDDDVESTHNTAATVERNKNREVLRNTVQAYALSHAYNLASKTEFDTIEQQEGVAEILESQYDKVVFNHTITGLKGQEIAVGLSDSTKAIITDQRISVQGLFDDNRVTLGRIITVYTTPTSTRLLAYQYYGESQLADEIAALNNFSANASFIDGDIEIVTS